MAYSRTRGYRRNSRGAGNSRSFAGRASGRARTRSRARGGYGARGNVVRLVVQSAPPDPVSRPDLANIRVESPARKAQF